MAKNKTTTDDTELEKLKTDYEQFQEDAASHTAELEERIKKLEDYVLSILTDLHVAKVNLQKDTPSVSKRFNLHYQQGRDLMGQRGLDIDKQLRG